MPSVEPSYYSSLARFENLFQSGRPILTYHKLGPRPSGAQLKGLYVSENLFAKQLTELKQAGYSTTPLDNIRFGLASSNRVLAITFDDGFRNALQFALKPLADNQFTATQFLVADLIGKRNEWDLASGERPSDLMNIIEIGEWLAAGHQIGSHTLTHPFLTRIPIHKAEEEIIASKKKLEDMFGIPILNFCYPYGDWNEKIRDLVARAGYETACTTDFGVNASQADPFALKRITARYPSRNWKAIKLWLAEKLLGRKMCALF
jgi:peptidoglycan/xylan/chitin deacetylase (PgdA/CDA1 family)